MPIAVKDLSYSYHSGTPMQTQALREINLQIADGEYVAIMGRTGCGKTTLIQLLTGLLVPTQGTVLLDGEDINRRGFDRTTLRRKVGLVFQYPECQLFETTVRRDVAFGLKHAGLSRREVDERVRRALELCGFSYDEICDKSPLGLSGGEKRRLAIAGVLAVQPQYLFFDEPFAGLDPLGREAFTDLTKRLNREGVTVVIVSHNADCLAECAKRILIMDSGRIVLDGAPEDVFRDIDRIQALHLGVSDSREIAWLLQERGIEIRSISPLIVSCCPPCWHISGGRNMNNHFTGQYVPGDGFLYRLDARAKLLCLLLFTVAVIAANGPAAYLAVAVSLLALLIFGRLRLRLVLGAVARLWLLYLMVFLTNALFYSTDTPLWKWWIFSLSIQGIVQGLKVIFTIVPIMIFNNILTQTTKPLALTGALQSLLSPLRYVRLPADEIAMILSVAIQFIPTLLEETDTIKKAQTARGARFESRRLHERAAAMLPLIVPVFLSAFQRADELATAMEARGYRGAKYRTRRRSAPLSASAWAALGASTALCAITLVLYFI